MFKHIYLNYSNFNFNNIVTILITGLIGYYFTILCLPYFILIEVIYMVFKLIIFSLVRIFFNNLHCEGSNDKWYYYGKFDMPDKPINEDFSFISDIWNNKEFKMFRSL